MAKELETAFSVVPQGCMLGMKMLSPYEQIYYKFEGIPFAKPPLGELRFRSPVPAESWQGVLNCTKCRSKPKQLNTFTGCFEGDEDCLYLNVYVKNFVTPRLPVLIFISGDRFIMGGATPDVYGPDFFMNYDVILVTFNYRLSVLGFLSFDNRQLNIPGNAGLKDQVLAIKWVKTNIEFLNGDPENITVFGNGAGAVSTHFMMLSERTRNLFQRGILQSGCCLNYWAYEPKKRMALRLARSLGYQGKDEDKSIFNFLRDIEAERLLNHNLLTLEEQCYNRLYAFGPVIESYITEDCVVPLSPLRMMKSNWGNNIPMILGGTSCQGLYMYRHMQMGDLKDAFRKDPLQVLPQQVRTSAQPFDAYTKAYTITNAHFSVPPPDAELGDFMDFYSVYMFWHGIHRTTMSRIQSATARTYVYRFDYASPEFNPYHKLYCGDHQPGVSHGEELAYMFTSRYARKLEEGSDEYKISQHMMTYWINFATSSFPNVPSLREIEWMSPSLENVFTAINITKEPEMINLPEAWKLARWNSIYDYDDLF